MNLLLLTDLCIDSSYSNVGWAMSIFFFFPPEGLSFRLVSYDNILSAFNNFLSVVPISEKGVECICMAY